MKVEIFSDVVCPWCYLGKTRFEKAVEELRSEGIDLDIELEWRSFELDPSAQGSYGMTLSELLSKKYGVSIDEAKRMNGRLASLGGEVGIDFDFDRARPGSTFDAHRLIKAASAHGAGTEMTNALMDAYFSHGAEIADHATLVEVANELNVEGLDPEAVLDTEQYALDVRSDQQLAQELEVTGVPFMVFEGAYGLPGAQDVEVYKKVILNLLSKTAGVS